MNTKNVERTKTVLGLILGLGIGAGCRYLGIPSPAPPVLLGALLVMAMTLGYLAAGKWLSRNEPKSLSLCGGPDGSTRTSVQLMKNQAKD